MKKQVKIQALINSGNKVNAMTPAYTANLELKICLNNIGAHKIDSSIIETFKMILASFYVKDKLNKAEFFKKHVYWLLLVLVLF